MRPAWVLLIASITTTCWAVAVDVARLVEAQLENVAAAIDAFHEDCGRFPTQAEFRLLTKEKRGCSRSYYLDASDLIDRWGNELIYEYAEGKKGFSLLSIGMDGKLGGGDDIVFGDAGKQWRSAYRKAIDPRDDFIDRWRNSIFTVMGLAAAATIAGFIQLRRDRRKP